MKNRYQAAVILGGGRYDETTLTPLSTMRLDHGWSLFQQGVFRQIILPGDNYSTYNPRAIKFHKTTARLRMEYLCAKGNITEQNVLLAEKGRDTIYEAFAVRELVLSTGIRRLLLITSEKHMRRALYIFRHVLGSDLLVDDGDGVGQVATGDLLLDDEEAEYLFATRKLFAAQPDYIASPDSWDNWYQSNLDFYEKLRTIHDRFHPPGHESQAYAGIKV